MRIVVVGGSGLVGRRLVEALRRAGHEAIAASRATGVDVLAGTGLADALRGAAAVVDVTNPPVFDQALDFFRTATRNLIAAEEAAGVGHHLILSIVGIDRLLGNPYYAAKLAQEETARVGRAPLTILRATQFFEFAQYLANQQEGDTIRLSTATMQPVAVDDVVAELARRAVAAPFAGTIELAGPERFPMDEFVRATLRALGDPRTVVTDETADAIRVGASREALVPQGGGAIIAPTTWAQWVARQGRRQTEAATL